MGDPLKTENGENPGGGCLTLKTVMWLLRCSVLRGTPMPATSDHDFKKLECYLFSKTIGLCSEARRWVMN